MRAMDVMVFFQKAIMNSNDPKNGSTSLDLS
jgi:hypothetical protein